MLGASSPEVAHEVDSRAVFFLGRGPDVQEGVDAFLEKRKAHFPLRVSRDLPDFVPTSGLHDRVATAAGRARDDQNDGADLVSRSTDGLRPLARRR